LLTERKKLEGGGVTSSRPETRPLFVLLGVGALLTIVILLIVYTDI